MRSEPFRPSFLASSRLFAPLASSSSTRALSKAGVFLSRLSFFNCPIRLPARALWVCPEICPAAWRLARLWLRAWQLSFCWWLFFCRRSFYPPHFFFFFFFLPFRLL